MTNSSNEPQDSTALLDDEMLSSLQALLGEKFRELIVAFLSDTKSRFERLASAMESGDIGVIKDEAHGIKGSSRNIGANGLADICSEVENLARRGHLDGDDLNVIEQKISAAQQNFAAVSAELEAYLS